MEFLPGCKSENCPDIISRVFRLKLEQLTTDIKKKAYFGKYVRGLPHVQMLIWLDSESKRKLKQNVDKYVSAEIPDPEKDPVGYVAVKAFMIHGPCGLQNTKSPCMQNLKCIRHFPKKYCARTMFDESGFPIYKRRRTNLTVNVRNAELDNQWVVPYNRDLLGHDTATVQVTGRKRKRVDGANNDCIDEIQAYFDGRYICGAESAYRIFGFPIHHRILSVERLPFHLPGQRNCTFRANESLGKVAEREKERLSKLEAFFLLNRNDSNALQYTYDEIPQHYVWNDGERKWNGRKRGEVWYLRMLLTKVRGPTSFKSLKTVNGVLYCTFLDACKEHGLLDDDKEWHEVLTQCAVGGLPTQMRQLFVHIIVNCKATDLTQLWDCHWKNMIEDILLKIRHLTKDNNLILNNKQIQFYALAEINDLLRSIGKSLNMFAQLSQPPDSYLHQGINNLILEETSYNIEEMEKENNKLLQNCNEEQLLVYNCILESIARKEGGLFFVHGSGGCGKTYLWRTSISKLRSQGDIVLPVASSGIVATLLPGGRTAHSRFIIPIILDDVSLCNIWAKLRHCRADQADKTHNLG
ncbi:uncharacterized protein LOC141659866 [Apium graveolens]|uniref:uncharacterized protein LOC141659866 n=1 Tax=Apium graveolens TaxID=4045 RepID=UPI003D79684F